MAQADRASIATAINPRITVPPRVQHRARRLAFARRRPHSAFPLNPHRQSLKARSALLCPPQRFSSGLCAAVAFIGQLADGIGLDGDRADQRVDARAVDAVGFGPLGALGGELRAVGLVAVPPEESLDPRGLDGQSHGKQRQRDQGAKALEQGQDRVEG
ncbi:MAG: hypothetical protein IPG83_02620 [Novosphingobium sp.]|nr:hypothetical protein [Novosphingobium sp.]